MNDTGVPLASATPTPVATSPASATSVAAAPVYAPAPVADPTMGRIVLVEPVAPMSQRGGSAALAIGASILGAFIPGPWGGVASVATGQAGSLALSSMETKSARYHVRMTDGTIRTVTQSGPISLPTGTPVQVLTLVDGTPRLVQTGLPAVPEAGVPATSP